MYFLPASLQWTTELLKYQPAWNGQIDPNSQAWRIVYEVTAYRYVDANGNIVIYPPAMAPATPSTAPQVDTTGGYVTGAYDNDGFTQWMQGDMVQYAVTFVNAAGESNFSAWSSWVQVGASICAGSTFRQIRVGLPRAAICTGNFNRRRRRRGCLRFWTTRRRTCSILWRR